MKIHDRRGPALTALAAGAMALLGGLWIDVGAPIVEARAAAASGEAEARSIEPAGIDPQAADAAVRLPVARTSCAVPAGRKPREADRTVAVRADRRGIRALRASLRSGWDPAAIRQALRASDRRSFLLALSAVEEAERPEALELLKDLALAPSSADRAEDLVLAIGRRPESEALAWLLDEVHVDSVRTLAVVRSIELRATWDPDAEPFARRLAGEPRVASVVRARR